MPFAPIFTVPKALRLPFEVVSVLEGDCGFGESVPSCLPNDGNVLVSRRGCLTWHSHDLAIESARMTVDGWFSLHAWGDLDVATDVNHFLFFQRGASKPDRELRLEAGNGEKKFLRALTGDHLLLNVRRQNQLRWLQCYSIGGRLEWQVELASVDFIGTGSGFLVVERDELRCLSVPTGEELWQFSAPLLPGQPSNSNLNWIQTGWAGVAVINDRVLVSLKDGRVFSLWLGSGEVIKQGRKPFNGPFMVTPSSIFTARPDALSEFDHEEMREVERIEYRAECDELYGPHIRCIHGMWLSEETALWTTDHGKLMAVSRKPGPGGKRATWSHKLDSIMPITECPSHWGNYLYYSSRGNLLGFKEKPGSLICFRGAEEAR